MDSCKCVNFLDDEIVSPSCIMIVTFTRVQDWSSNGVQKAAFSGSAE